MTFSVSQEHKYFSPFFFYKIMFVSLKKKISLTRSMFELVGKCPLGMLHGPVSLQCTKPNVQYLFTGHLFYYWKAQPHFDPFALATSRHLLVFTPQ